MADTAQRVQRWRQRLKDEGKEALTIYLAHDAKLRLDDLAHTWRCSPSEIVQQALAAFHPGSPSRLPLTDPLQIRALIQEELARLLSAESHITETLLNVPVTPTDQRLPLPPDSTAPASTSAVQPERRAADIGRAMSTGHTPVPLLPEVDLTPDVFDLDMLPYPGAPASTRNVQPEGDTGDIARKGNAGPAPIPLPAEVLPPGALDYDPEKFHLGPLCSKPGHAYRNTGQSLRTKQDRCRLCLNEANEKSRQRKKQSA